MPLHYKGADGIRGLACLIVLLIHASAFFFPGTFPYLAGTGKIGVWLFFVLSAFLLTSKFLYVGIGVLELSKYAIGRFLRIIPLFVIAILIYWRFRVFDLNTINDVVSTILMVKAVGHFWTIPIEFEFYFLLPIVAFIFSRCYARFGCLWTIALFLALTVIHQSVWGFWNNPNADVQMVWYIPTFMMGCLAAVIMPDVRKFVTPGRATAVGLIVMAVAVLMSPGARNYFFGLPLDGWLVNKYLYLGALWFVFILFLADGKGLLGAFLSSRPMRLIGAWSYSIYLMHLLFYIKLSERYINNYVVAIFGVACALGCGAAMYYLIEGPIEKFRHSLQRSAKMRRIAQEQDLT